MDRKEECTQMPTAAATSSRTPGKADGDATTDPFSIEEATYEEAVGQVGLPKIYYATRTHSQIAQVLTFWAN